MYSRFGFIAFSALLAVHETAAALTSRQLGFEAGPLLQPSKRCGKDDYSPGEYICRNGTLCPIVNGEPLSLCGRACYSEYLYTCRAGTDLQIRPPLRRGSITLRAENPQEAGLVPTHPSSPSSPPPPAPPAPPYSNPNYGDDASVHGKPMTGCRLSWNVGGVTCSYCPVPQVDPRRCPEGNVTALSAGTNAMDVVVPGGQRFFLTRDWTVGYTQAHSALMPNGSTTAGFRAYEGGGFFNLLDGARGWAACGRGAQRVLHVRNGTNDGELAGCVGLNLRVERFEGVGAWQYS